MKKNFLKIAAMLIAAMLLVVSCSQEIAPKNDGLVSASVSIADTRSLSTTGEALNSNVRYQYTLKPLFSQIDTNTSIKGEVDNWAPIPTDNKLGYVTQGLWEINVRGIVEETVDNQVKTTVLLEGSANHYFNNQNEVAKVFVNPTTGTGTVRFDGIEMQDLDQNEGTKYDVKYALTKIDAPSESAAVSLDRTPVSGKQNISSYSSSAAVAVDTGYYRLTISVWGPAINETDGSIDENAEKVLLGGITKSIRVLNGSAIIVTGSIEPKDFDKSDVKVVLIEPKGRIGKNDESPVTGKDIVVTVTDSTEVEDLTKAGYIKKTNGVIEESDGNAYAVSYIWDVNGAKVEGTSNKTTVNFDVPGPKTVSCAIVYKVKSFGKTYTYVSAINDSLSLSFIVNEAQQSN